MTREAEILSAGRQILLSEGLRALTTDEVARRARVSKKTLYSLFPSKDALVEAVVVSFIEANLARWDEVLETEETAMDRIVASLDLVTHFLPQIQTSVISQVGRVAPSLWERIDAMRLERVARLGTLMEEAQRDGYIRDDIDPAHWFLLLTATIRSALTPQVLLETRIPLPSLLDALRKIYCDGLLTEKGRQYVAARQGKEKP
ncbi:MAG: TetR/AcrR family transcriptional regulator [Candidatus Bipolaricaulis sp.]|nr:TetR/AcrR family transcriptional regulator [Candidatus Bipolaricaulis sp.]